MTHVSHHLTSLRKRRSSENPKPSAQLPIHIDPPPRPEPPHRPYHNAARHRDDTNAGEKPAVADDANKRLRNHGAHKGENVADEIADGDSTRCLLWHEFRQHGTDAEEEIGDERYEPEDATVGRPTVPDQSCRVEKGGYPGVFAHAVFRSVHQFPLVVVASRLLGFARHDGVGPLPAEEGGEDVADAVGDVGQADDGGGEAVGSLGEGGLQGDVEEVEGAEGDGGVVDCQEDGGEAQVEDYAEGVDEEAAG